MNNKRKVLFVAHHLTIGGVQRSLVQALNVIDYSENDVTLYLRKKRLDLLPQINKNVRVLFNEINNHYYRRPIAIVYQILTFIFNAVKKPVLAQKYRDRLNTYILYKGIIDEKKRYFSNGTEYDVAISFLSGYTALFTAIAVRATRKIVFHHSGIDDFHDLYEEIFSEYDNIVAINDNVACLMKEAHPRYADKIIVLENYQDFRMIQKRSAEYTADIVQSPLILCSCGRFTEEKGFDIAVYAAKELAALGVAFHWYFVGDGPERAALENLIESYCLTDRITVTGMLDNPYPHMASCDIYVQPSRNEAYGLTIAEAIMLYKPIVSTDTVGGRFLQKQNNCVLISKTNGPSLAEKIVELFNDSAMRECFVATEKAIDYEKREADYRNAWKSLLSDR